MKKRSNLLIMFFLFLISVPILAPLFHGGFFTTDDADWMIIRFTAFHQALADGQFPVRFLPRLNFDYGYPVANFLYPGFMYFGEIFHLLKIGFIDSIKIVMALSLVGSALFSFLWLSRLFSQTAAFAGAIVYLYAPYHVYDIYVRGSVGEVLALALIPFLFWSIERKSWPLLAIGVGGLILSHNTLAALFVPLILFYILIKNNKKWSENKEGLISLFLGIGVSAFFWFPALYDLRYTVFFHTQVSEWRQYFTEISLIGIFNAFVLLTGVLLIPLKRRIKKLKESEIAHLLELFVVSGVLAVFLSVQISEVAWSLLPISFIQFPFRFLSVEILSTAFLTAILIHVIHKKKIAIIFTMIVCAIAVTSAFPTLKKIQFVDRIDSYYATNEDTTTVKKEYMPLWVKDVMVGRPEKKIEVEKAQIVQQFIESNKITFTVLAEAPSTITINTLYFPGWKAKIDGKDAIISYDNPHGVIQLSLPRGEHRVNVYFSETLERMIADISSLVSLLLIGIWAGKSYRYGKR